MNSKNTRKALVFSLLSLLLCCSMLVGTTFAWFTDSVTSGNNRIVAGNLDVGLEYWNGTAWAEVKTDTNVFADALWEPGHTEVVRLKVSNLGTLALKYRLSVGIVEETGSVNKAGEDFLLSDHIKFGVIEGQQDYTREEAIAAVDATATLLSEDYDSGMLELLPKSAQEGSGEAVVTMVVYMPSSVGNEANHALGEAQPTILLGLDLVATQLTYEEDSFDDQYDAGTALPGKFDITNAQELGEAMAAGGEGTVLNDFDLAFGDLTEGKELVLDLGGKTVTGGTVATGDVSGGAAVFENTGKLTIRNGTVNSDYITVDNKGGTLVLEELNLNTTDLLYGFYNHSGDSVLTDVSVKAKRGGMNIQAGKVILDGVKVEVDGYSNKVGYGIYAASNDGAVEVVVEYAEFTYNQGYTKYSVIYAGQNASVIIKDGIFGKGGTGHKSGGWIRTGGGTVTIYGGTFEFDPSAFVAEGYEAVKGDDGWWTVAPVAGGI